MLPKSLKNVNMDDKEIQNTQILYFGKIIQIARSISWVYESIF